MNRCICGHDLDTHVPVIVSGYRYKLTCLDFNIEETSIYACEDYRDIRLEENQNEDNGMGTDHNTGPDERPER